MRKERRRYGSASHAASWRLTWVMENIMKVQVYTHPG
jgi:hypothetical protein